MSPLWHAPGFSGDEKLQLLRRLDAYRKWQSLSDIRYCLCCEELITGEQIQVISEAAESDSLRLRCPTAGCESIALDWVLPSDEVLANNGNHESLPAQGQSDHAHSNPGKNLVGWLRMRVTPFRRTIGH